MTMSEKTEEYKMKNLFLRLNKYDTIKETLTPDSKSETIFFVCTFKLR